MSQSPGNDPFLYGEFAEISLGIIRNEKNNRRTVDLQYDFRSARSQIFCNSCHFPLDNEIRKN
jgi:hypothetical protein